MELTALSAATEHDTNSDSKLLEDTDVELTRFSTLHKYPQVKQLVAYNTLNTIMILSSGPVESLFSFSELIHRQKRNRLADKTDDTRSAFKSKFRQMFQSKVAVNCIVSPGIMNPSFCEYCTVSMLVCTFPIKICFLLKVNGAACMQMDWKYTKLQVLLFFLDYVTKTVILERFSISAIKCILYFNY